MIASDTGTSQLDRLSKHNGRQLIKDEFAGRVKTVDRAVKSIESIGPYSAAGFLFGDYKMNTFWIVLIKIGVEIGVGVIGQFVSKHIPAQTQNRFELVEAGHHRRLVFVVGEYLNRRIGLRELPCLVPYSNHLFH